MKTNTFKFIFFIIVVLLISLSVYILYKDGKKEKINITANNVDIDIIKELNIGIASFDNINPILSKNRDIQYIDKLIFDSLINITSNFKIENSLAKEISKINDSTYIIKLKDNINWHDGVNFTARDVIFTIQNLKDGKINSIYNNNVKSIDQILEIDEYTIKIMLKEKTPFFEYMLCFPILASHAYEDNTLNSKTTVPVGTGKYRISEIKDNTIQIVKSDYENDGKITKINIVLKNSVKDLYVALTRNEIDFITTDNIEYEEYIGTMGYKANISTGREFDYLALNNQKTLLSNKEIRQAICYAIDRNSINYIIYNNKYNVSNFPLGYGSYLYNLQDTFEYNVNKAKSILVENGWIYKNNSWRKGKNKLEFNLIVKDDNEKRVLIAEKIKEQLGEIGIIINIVKVGDTQYNNYVKNKNYDMILTGNIVSNTPNVDTYFGENNLSNFYNDEIRNIIAEISNITNEEILKEKYYRLQEIYKEEIPFISLYFNSIFILYNSDLKGDFSHNWYNLYYNIDNWYRIK